MQVQSKSHRILHPWGLEVPSEASSSATDLVCVWVEPGKQSSKGMKKKEEPGKGALEWRAVKGYDLRVAGP